MSEETNTPVEATPEVEQPKIPQDVLDLDQALRDLASYKTAFQTATFPGGQVEAASKMRTFLNDAYKSALDQFNAHPYVIEARKKQKQLEEDRAKLKA